MRRTCFAVSALAIGGLAACGQGTSSPTATTSDCRVGAVSSNVSRTAGYQFTAAAVGVQVTYTKAQVDSEHPTHGQLMLRGHMTDVPGMPMGDGGSGMHGSGPSGMPGAGPGAADPTAYHHVEVQICSRTSGKVVQDASPDLSLIDRSAHDTSQHLPLAMMQGVRSGAGDTHYGNNAHMVRGHRYALDVTLGGEHVRCDLGTAP